VPDSSAAEATQNGCAMFEALSHFFLLTALSISLVHILFKEIAPSEYIHRGNVKFLEYK
jgi:hypothetical protein